MMPKGNPKKGVSKMDGGVYGVGVLGNNKRHQLSISEGTIVERT